MNKNKKKVKEDDIRIENDYGEDFVAQKKWYEEVADDPDTFPPVTDQILIELKEEAKKCHDAEVSNYNIKNSKTNSDYRWMKTIMSKGTVSDKIAAYTVAIQENPICNLNTLQNIVGMVKVGKKKECIMIIETLTELFLTDLLRPDKKLKQFNQRPLSLLNEMSSGNAVTRRKLLSAWYFEDQLKETYCAYVLALNAAAHDSVESNKEKAISAMYKLLAGNPEQEKNLLTYIVNKLGDPSQKVASKAIYCLSQLLYQHWNMQGVVLDEVEKLIFRPNVSTRAQYYGLCFLSQFYLSHEGSEIARQLVKVYFSFFKACIKKGEIDSRMMSVLLMGVNRAYPYAKLELEKISEHINTLYKVVHVANFNVSLHTLTLLYQVSDFTNSINDRFYSALYRKLLDLQLINTTHQAILLNLIYKSLMKDKELSRVKIFVKRLLQIALITSPNFSCGILYLVSHLLGKKDDLRAFLLKKTDIKIEDDDEDEEEKYEDVKETVEIKIKDDEPDEISETKPEENGELIDEAVIKEEPQDDKPDIISGSWYHCSRNDFKKNPSTAYAPLNRNPLYAGGDFCAYTELLHLKNHYHPSVALFAKNILDGEVIRYQGDPLKDFSLIRFLDRFVFKNPKKIEDVSKQGAHPTFGIRKNYKPTGIRALPITSESYINEKEHNIPVDELFVFMYLKKKKHEQKIKKEDEDSDLESVASDEFEEMLDKMAGRKGDDGDDDDDDEIDFMNEIENTLRNKKSKKSEENEDNSDEGGEELDEEFDSDDLDEDDKMNKEDENLIDDLSDDDLSDIEFGSDEELDDKHNNKKSKTKKKGKSEDLNSIFASAEEFSSILEDEGTARVRPGGSNVVSNMDNADQKQIDWEAKRNKWLHNFDKAVGKKKFKSDKSKRFNKRTNSNKSKSESNPKKRKKV